MTRLIYTFLLLGTIFGCSKTETAPTPKPTADFSWKESTNGTVQFTNASKNGDSYQWDFGDNIGKSTSQNPSYTFEFKGSYQVKLIAKNTVGESEATSTVNITTGKDLAPIANFEITNLGKGQLQFVNKSKNADTYEWDFGDKTSISKNENVSHQYLANAKYTITLKATGKGGVNTKTLEYEITDIPIPEQRDKFIGTWNRAYSISGQSGENKQSNILITKSSLKSDVIIIKFSASDSWEATIKNDEISYSDQEYIGGGAFVYFSGTGKITTDNKTINLKGTYKFGTPTNTPSNTTEVWTKQ
jgi:PKD repeat protein